MYNFLHPRIFDYPAGMPFLHLLIYWIFILPFVFFKMFFLHPSMIFALINLGPDFFNQFRESIFGLRDVNALYWSRYIAAVVSAGAVVLTYFTAKRLFNKSAGIFAAIFLTFNFRHVLSSHFALPDIHSSFFNMLALYASVLLFEKNTRKRYIIAGLTAGIALTMKYQPFAFLPFLTVHVLWAIKKKSFWYLFYKDFIFGLLASFVAFVVINPYYLFNIKLAMYRNSLDYRWYGMGDMRLRGYQYFYLFHWGIGSLPSLAIIAGMLLALFMRFRKFLVIFSFVTVFFFITTYYSNAYTRNFAGVVPILMIFAGFFMSVLYDLIKKINLKLGIVLIVIILGIFNFSSIKNVVILDINYSKGWNIENLSSWMGKFLPKNVTIRTYSIAFSPQVRSDQTNKNNILKDWDYLKDPHSVTEFQDEGTSFAILNTAAFQLATYWWRGWDDYRRYFKYNTIPFDYIQNGFFGLSMKELMQYTVYEIYKPWQAQDQKNYLVFKIPEKPKELGEKIVAFNFDKGDEGWKPINPFNFPPMVGGWIKDMGNNFPGSLTIKSAGNLTQRIVSEPIKIKPGLFYAVRGFLKAEKALDPQERDGYIRIDMYKSLADANGNILGEVVSVSQRVYEDGEWTEVQASLTASKNVEYLTISFQRNSSLSSGNYLDDVELFETNFFPQETFKELPYIKPTIPLESLYYNSFL
jgi:hypothetical protein